MKRGMKIRLCALATHGPVPSCSLETSSTILPSRPSNNLTKSNNPSPAATFSWSTPPVSPPPATNLSAPKPQGRSVTPDATLSSLNSSFPALSAANPGIGSSSYNPPQQQSRPAMSMGSTMTPSTTTITPQSSGIDWSKAANSSSNAWASTSSTPSTNTSSLSSFPSMTPALAQPSAHGNPYSSFSIAPPPIKPANTGTFSIPPPPSMGSRTTSATSGMGMGMNNSMASLRAQTQTQNQHPPPKQQQQQQMNWGSGGDSLI
ncbi:uncharacterized protein SETTUDRAFT_34970 [Exserohilum turcica Et28A]|uniref:Uncharacterized protein n=1 Tax=Exserohilum turcicum (strain 28A) TaxID=671987 RepID=R0JLX3_EXST2|nr:uncharacterized protein SETTUDRAFT_34970 [Exserohilum turcica Et28A]EOA82238.1 hypothetical protein SETTUDRAFT_34970 [Exserohilum turcica Et28A]